MTSESFYHQRSAFRIKNKLYFFLINKWESFHHALWNIKSARALRINKDFSNIPVIHYQHNTRMRLNIVTNVHKRKLYKCPSVYTSVIRCNLWEVKI